MAKRILASLRQASVKDMCMRTATTDLVELVERYRAGMFRAPTFAPTPESMESIERAANALWDALNGAHFEPKEDARQHESYCSAKGDQKFQRFLRNIQDA